MLQIYTVWHRGQRLILLLGLLASDIPPNKKWSSQPPRRFRRQRQIQGPCKMLYERRELYCAIRALYSDLRRSGIPRMCAAAADIFSPSSTSACSGR